MLLIVRPSFSAPKRIFSPCCPRTDIHCFPAVLKEEVEIGMRLLGAQSVKDLTPDMVEILPGLVGEQQH